MMQENSLREQGGTVRGERTKKMWSEGKGGGRLRGEKGDTKKGE